jgi:hypothetical protein
VRLFRSPVRGWLCLSRLLATGIFISGRLWQNLICLGWFNVSTAYRDAAPSSSRMGAVSISVQGFLADVVKQGKPFEDLPPMRRATVAGRPPAQSTSAGGMFP